MKHVTSIENSLTNLGRLNHHLADEVAKLPEIRKFRTESSRLALSNLLKIYQFAPGGFDRMFDAMDKIGMPAYRKYCSPVQALLWLIQDENLSASGMLFGLKIEKIADKKGNCRPHLISVLEPPKGKTDSTGLDRHYTLEKVLDAAWSGENLLMQSSNIHQIIHRIQKQSEVDEYALLVKRHDDLQLQSYNMDDFLRKREIFDVNDWQQIETAIEQSRWKAFYLVADRLNSPELVRYYLNFAHK
jgi:hypothetical protein